jgi:Tfp pilus assembly protein FimT
MNPTTRFRARRSGYSLVELILSSSLLAIMALTVVGLASTGSDTSEYSGRLNRITEIAQDELTAVRRDATASVRLFTNDAQGLAYLDRLDRSNHAGLTAARLPELDSQGTFRRDTVANERTGNVLFFVRHDRTHEWTHPVQPGVAYRIDLYRFVAFYLRRVHAGPLTDADNGLDLCRWLSVPFADANQVEDIADSDHRKLVLESLLRGENQAAPTRPFPICPYAWRFGSDLSVALSMQRIVTGGSLTDLTGPSMPTFMIPADQANIRQLRLWRRGVSVATNFARSNLGVSRFALMNSTGDGFPHGFELQIIGPAAARQVLIHISLLSTQRRGAKAFVESSVVADCRDL